MLTQPINPWPVFELLDEEMSMAVLNTDAVASDMQEESFFFSFKCSLAFSVILYRKNDAVGQGQITSLSSEDFSKGGSCRQMWPSWCLRVSKIMGSLQLAVIIHVMVLAYLFRPTLLWRSWNQHWITTVVPMTCHSRSRKTWHTWPGINLTRKLILFPQTLRTMFRESKQSKVPRTECSKRVTLLICWTWLKTVWKWEDMEL